MNRNEIIELFHNEEFIEKFKSVNTKEDAIALFKKNGVELSDEDDEYLQNICSRYVKSNEKLDEEELSQVVAGVDYKRMCMEVGEKLGTWGAVASNYCKIFANSCIKGYNDMNNEWEKKENKM